MLLNADCTAVEEVASTLDVAVPFTIQAEDTKAGRRMRVLRLASRPWSGITDHYGFVRRDVAGFRQPDFSWLPDQA